MPNYSFVVDNSFRPFSMQEMLVPLTAYKEAYEQAEEKYTDLKTKADVFKDLSNSLPDGSKAKAIYDGYAKDLNAYAEDFAQHGLNMGNRSGLTKLRQRYQGEIGLLTEAKTKLEKELDLRRQMSAKDPSILYALNNADLNIDSFLGGNTPNDYSISGDSLYAKGMAAGKAASSRIYSDPQVRKLDKYYNEYFSTIGYSPEKMQEFRDNLAAIPELQKAAMNIASANRIGELGEGSNNYKAALQQIVNGIADGAIFQRQSNMQRDLSVMTAAEEQSAKLGWANHQLDQAKLDESKRQHNLQMMIAGYDPKTGEYDSTKDQTVKRAAAITAAKSGGSGSRGGSTMRDTQTSGRIRLKWHGDNPADTNDGADNDYTVEEVANDDTGHPGTLYSYDRLPTYVRKAIAPLIGDGKQHLYNYYFQPYEGGFFDDDEASVEIVPRKIITQDKISQEGTLNGSSGLNDIPE